MYNLDARISEVLDSLLVLVICIGREEIQTRDQASVDSTCHLL